ncbi:Methyltransferase domain-containing protein [Desulfatibacillum alkenivorans DSM 16219]|jgi:SAM-dependent methyltransferase|uniref:Methyltransferase domain-containing protein n=1 Tax=Desulfatibacillum alkenivorans DSM 16219 TaxID=1121393 RepID=A0A1M6NL73_9BACT|nr:methyltransferase domain-containing protein [Desulfatibacillum alkenivorans]SHJ96489.1 Methyltransferase domain-containing protein [Desulfatibacillum alkenivorans DSM 16219]
MTENLYVHGYSEREKERLEDQANTLTELLHHDTVYPPGSRVLEAGCGVGAQTVTLAAKSPDAQITSIDISPESLAAAQARIIQAGFTNVTFQQANIFDLPFEPESFDHLFLCFVLEHLPNPDEALDALQTMIRPGGTITVIEGDHGSTYFHPQNPYAAQCVQCLVYLQSQMGGDSLIGRRLFPLLKEAGFQDVQVSPRMVYVDGSKPDLVEGFTKNTFTAMVEGVREKALEQGLMDPRAWEQGIRGLRRAAEEDGVFCYTFFKGMGIKK